LPGGELPLAEPRANGADAGPLSFPHPTPRDSQMDLTCSFPRPPLFFHRHIGNFCWKASRMTLCLVFVERSVILPPQHFRSSQFTEDFIAAFFLEDLFNRL